MDASAAIALRRGIISFVANHSDKFVTYSYWLLGIGIALAIFFIAYLVHQQKSERED